MDEIFDNDLARMVNFTDETVPAQMPVMERKVTEAPKEMPAKQEAAMDEKYEPVKKKRSDLDRLVDMTKWVCICGGISMLLWWFENNGLMALEAAYPCIIGCALLAGFGVGKNLVQK